MRINWKEEWHLEMLIAIPFMLAILYLLVSINSKL